MMYYFSSVASYLLLATALFFSITNVAIAVKMPRTSDLQSLKSGVLIWKGAMMLVTWLAATKIGRVAGVIGLGVLMGIPVGMTIDSRIRDSNTYERYGVTILEKNSPRVYQMHETEAGTYQAVFCEDENFDKGERLKLIRYLDKGTCWKLQGKKLGFIYAKGDSNHEGWNSNPHAHTIAYTFTVAQAR
jgi:hypothetical protein